MMAYLFSSGGQGTPPLLSDFIVIIPNYPVSSTIFLLLQSSIFPQSPSSLFLPIYIFWKLQSFLSGYIRCFFSLSLIWSCSLEVPSPHFFLLPVFVHPYRLKDHLQKIISTFFIPKIPRFSASAFERKKML